MLTSKHAIQPTKTRDFEKRKNYFENRKETSVPSSQSYAKFRFLYTGVQTFFSIGPRWWVSPRRHLAFSVSRYTPPTTTYFNPSCLKGLMHDEPHNNNHCVQLSYIKFDALSVDLRCPGPGCCKKAFYSFTSLPYVYRLSLSFNKVF